MLVPRSLMAVLWNDILNLDTRVEFSSSRDAVAHLAQYNRFLNTYLNDSPSAHKLRRAHL